MPSRHDTGPQMIVEQPRNLSIPIKISILKSKNRTAPIRQPTLVNFFKTMRFQRRKARSVAQTPPTKYGTGLCRWLREKRAVNQLINEHKKEIKAAKEKEQTEFEQERLGDFIRLETLKYKQSPVVYEMKHKSVFDKSDKPIVEKQKYKPPRPPKPGKLQPEPLVQTPSPVLEKHQLLPHPTYKSPLKYERAVGTKYNAAVVVARNCEGPYVASPGRAQTAKKSKSVYVKK